MGVFLKSGVPQARDGVWIEVPLKSGVPQARDGAWIGGSPHHDEGEQLNEADLKPAGLVSVGACFTVS